jgi:hypothetical protein
MRTNATFWASAQAVFFERLYQTILEGVQKEESVLYAAFEKLRR